MSTDPIPEDLKKQIIEEANIAYRNSVINDAIEFGRNFNEIIIEIADEFGLTLQDLSNMTLYDQSVLSKIRKGALDKKSPTPKPVKVFTFAIAFVMNREQTEKIIEKCKVDLNAESASAIAVYWKIIEQQRTKSSINDWNAFLEEYNVPLLGPRSSEQKSHPKSESHKVAS